MNFLHWLVDYSHAAKGHIHSLIIKKPQGHYISDSDDKGNVILIPGVYSKWHFLKKIGDSLSREGYSVHIVEKIKYNRRAIHEEAAKLHVYIEENHLTNIVLITHSKGGLIGKHYLVHHNKDGKVVKLVAIATPFSGTNIGKIVKTQTVKELLPESESILSLNKVTDVNYMITSIFPESDNHVWHDDQSYLENAENIVLKLKGHHKILDSKELVRVIKQKLES